MKRRSCQRPTLASIEVTALAVIAVAISLATPLLLPPIAHAAPDAIGNCPQHNNGKDCYGAVVWPNNILGSIAEITTEPLYSVNDGTDHISNEMWDIDVNAACTGIYSTTWVETGEATRKGQVGNWYFLAWCMPKTGYQEDWLYQPPGSDVGNFQSYQTYLGSDDLYHLEMVNVSNGIEQWSAVVESDSTVPSDIQIGLETTNNSYSVTHSQTAYFTGNQWDGWPNGGWHYQTNPGQTHQNQPPYWTWGSPPSPSNPGGLGYTDCC